MYTYIRQYSLYIRLYLVEIYLSKKYSSKLQSTIV
jgi:hypothetical protein